MHTPRTALLRQRTCEALRRVAKEPSPRRDGRDTWRAAAHCTRLSHRVVGESIAYERVGRVVTVVHPLQEPKDAEWAQYLSFLQDTEQLGVSVLVYSVGGGPNSKQRRALAEATNGKVLPTAVVTPSAVTRAIGVAVSWFNPHIRMFAPIDLQDGLAYLGFSPRESAEVLDAARDLANALSIGRAKLDLSLAIRVPRAG